MRSTKESNLIREQVSFIYVEETCTHELVVESCFAIYEGEPYHDQANLEAKYEVKQIVIKKERKRGFWFGQKAKGGS